MLLLCLAFGLLQVKIRFRVFNLLLHKDTDVFHLLAILVFVTYENKYWFLRTRKIISVKYPGSNHITHAHTCFYDGAIRCIEELIIISFLTIN